MNFSLPTEDDPIAILQGDCLDVLRTLPDECVNCVVTSPPYWGLRDYGVTGQLGLEPTPEEYVANMVNVFREVRRVLRSDGVVFLNLGDSYCNESTCDALLKPKDLVGIPWRVAFALQADGWWLRQDIIWAKPNSMPESVTDRCTKAHEYVFLLAKSARYWYDLEAIREPLKDGADHDRRRAYVGAEYGVSSKGEQAPATPGRMRPMMSNPAGRNRRSVWTIATQPYPGAHFATFPPALIEPMILAGCPKGGIVLDPFAGSGTTMEVAVKNRRLGIGIELNPDYIALANKRLREPLGIGGLFDPAMMTNVR